MKFTIKYILLAIIIISIVLFFFYNRVLIVSSNIENSPIEPYNNITLSTYNIHRGIDSKGNSNLDNVADIINKNQIDIVGLNEVDQLTSRSGFKNQIKILANKTNMNYVYGANLYISLGKYGNGLLSKYPIITARNHSLPGIKQNETRGMIDATILLPNNKQYHVLVTHLSLEKEERKLQLSWIENYISKLDRPYFLMGDFNGELEFSELLVPVINNMKTYPADKPKKQIDYIFTNADINIIDKKSLNSVASDHLQLLIEFVLA